MLLIICRSNESAKRVFHSCHGRGVNYQYVQQNESSFSMSEKLVAFQNTSRQLEGNFKLRSPCKLFISSNRAVECIINWFDKLSRGALQRRWKFRHNSSREVICGLLFCLEVEQDGA